jgi:Glycosyl hydrolases family 32 N-terminal domain
MPHPVRPSPGPRVPEPDRFWSAAEVVLAPEDPRPGAWVGGPSALLVDGTWWLAYRLRRPVGEGRGFANVVARSADGVRFTPVVQLGKDDFGAESLERPALVRTPEGRWRLYVSCATPGSKHWRVDLLEAGTVEGLATAAPRTVLPGSGTAAVKDPVIRYDGRQWHLWASVHPLDEPHATDRMTTEHATSPDGVHWTWRGTALTGTPGSWDARGVRFATVVLDGDSGWALYDGRATAAENWEERTGLAVSDGNGAFVAAAEGPLLQSPHPPGGLRYADVVALPDGRARWFYEATRADGAHELRTVLLAG